MGFAGEPFAWLLPWHLNKLIAGSNPKVQGRAAERFLASMPMDLSRYADILLNTSLVASILYFPSGFFLQIFVSFVVCHICVLIFDHIRVLRAHEGFYYASDKIDRFMQGSLAFPCGLMASAVVFRYYSDN